MSTVVEPGLEPDLEEETLRRCRAHLGRGRAALAELVGGEVETSSAGAWVRTASGRELLNCGGYGVLIMGSRHPRVVAEVAAQLARNPVATRLLLEPTVASAAEALVAVAPRGLSKVHFANSGAEAVEAALKMARTKGKRRLVSTLGGYHGKTFGALSVTSRPCFQEPFRPLLPDVTHVPFGDAAALDHELRRDPAPACVVVEPVQAEAGVILPPPGYLADVQGICHDYDAFFVLDEVQTGLGRLGHWWGADAEGVTPDALLSGKALGGGVMPVSAVIATPDAFSAFDRDPLLHTSTFSGSPLGMAAVLGALAAIENDGLVERAAALGDLLCAELGEVVTSAMGGLVREVRGAGLLIGLEFTGPDVATELLVELNNEGVVVNTSLNSSCTVRLTPPAVLDGAEVRFLLDAFARAGHTVARWHR